MISSILVEAALRSVLLALAVWIGLRMLGVRNVLAQKAAWGLVLAGALVMPMILPVAARVPAALVIPAEVTHLLAAIRTPFSGIVRPPAVAPTKLTAVESEAAIEPKPSVPPTFARRHSGRVRVSEFRADESNSVAADRYPAPFISDARSGAVSATPMSPSHAYGWPSPLEMTGLLYLAIAGVLLFRLFYGLMAAMQVWQLALPVLLDASPLTDGLNLRVSEAVSSPVTIGSTVLLPVDFGDWDDEKLRIVLAHERSHVRQGDFYLQLLSAIYAAAFWPSPLGWWLKRKLSDLAEAISDRAGLEEASDRTSYAQILLEFAAAPRPTLIGVAMARSGSLSRRIERLLNDVSFRQAFAGSRRALATVLISRYWQGRRKFRLLPRRLALQKAPNS
jgi:BlaR1 peptidase M56